MKNRTTWLVGLLVMAGTLAFSSCKAPKDVVYFQDLKPGVSEVQLAQMQSVTARPEDKLSIVVNSRDPQLTNLFNLATASKRVGSSSGSSSGDVSCYMVDSKGNIDFPVLGTLHVAGMKREEVADFIKRKLMDSNLVKDPVVTVEFANLGVSVMGEVASPGRYAIDRDHLTLLEALSQAGDLTIYGNRKNVLVMRQEGEVQRVYRVDLTSGNEVYRSPVYYLHQNDVVYVEPNNMKARQSTVNGNTVRSTSFWFSLVSLLTSLVVLIVK